MDTLLQSKTFIEGEPFVSRQVFPPFWFWWLFPPRPPGPWFPPRPPRPPGPPFPPGPPRPPGPPFPPGPPRPPGPPFPPGSPRPW